MSPMQLLTELRKRGVKLWLEGETLKFKGPKGALTAELKQQMKASKDALIELLAAASGANRRDDIEPLAFDDRAPLSFAQQRLWLIDQMAHSSREFNIPAALSLHGDLNVDALRSAFSTIVERHQCLRTVIKADEQGPYQQVLSGEALTLPLVDLTDVSEAEQPERIEQLIVEQAAIEFKLDQDLMLRLCLVKQAEQRHTLIVVVHHIASDGWSMGLMVNEFNHLYNMAGSFRQLPPLDIQYRDFAAWQQTQWQKGHYKKHGEFWQQALEGAPEYLALPHDQANADEADLSVATHSMTLDTGIAESLKRLAIDNNTTLFMVLNAALSVLMKRWTAQPDMVFGTVVAGREVDQVNPLIGCFMNALVLRYKVDETLTVAQWLEQTRTTVQNAFRHQDYPFDLLVQDRNPERKVGRNPLFNVGLVLQNYQVDSLQLDGVKVDILPVPAQAAVLDLRFVFTEKQDELVLDLEFKTALFEAATAEQVCEAFKALLTDMAAQPQATLTDLAFDKALTEQAAKSAARQPHGVIAATFTAEPLAPVLDFWGNKLGSDMLWQFADYNQVHQQLLDTTCAMAVNQNGINVFLLRWQDWLGKGDDAVATLNDAVSGFVGLLSARLQKQTLPHLIVICPAEANEAYAAAKQQVLQLAEQFKQLQVITVDQLQQRYPVEQYADAVADELGHIPYTSEYFAALGTQLVRHEQACRRAPYKVLVMDCDNTLWTGVCGEGAVEIDKARAELQRFALAQKEQGMLLALNSKNNLEDAVAVFEQHPDMVLTMNDIATHRINWGSKADNLISMAEELNLDLNSFIFIDDDVVQCSEVRTKLPQVLTIQLPLDESKLMPCIDNVWGFDKVADDSMKGERSAFYQQNQARKELEAASVSIHDYLDSLKLQIEVRPLAEGDIPRASDMTLRTNQFNFTTRRFQQAELVQHLEQAGHSALVVSVSDRFGDYGIVGLVMLAEQDNTVEMTDFLLSCRALGRGVEHHIIRHLAEQMQIADSLVVRFARSAKNRPAQIFLETLPVGYNGEDEGAFTMTAEQAGEVTISDRQPQAEQTSNKNQVVRKVQDAQSDRYNAIALDLQNGQAIEAAVGEHARGASRQQAPYEAPVGEVACQLAEMWQKLLGCEKVGANDDFFLLGGHSLLGIRLLSDIRTTFAVSVTVADLFGHLQLAKLATLIESKPKLAQGPAIEIVDREQPIVASYAQQRLWFIDQLEGNSSHYNLPGAIRIEGRFDVTVAEQAFTRIIERHETLRSRFVTADDKVLVDVSDMPTFTIEQLDISLLDDEEQQQDLARLIEAQQQQSFDLSAGLLLNARYVKTSENGGMLLFNAHHIASDGWSLGVVVQEFVSLYQAGVEGREAALPELTVGYGDFAAWQQQQLAGEDMTAQLDYWREQLADLPQVHSLPLDFHRPEEQSFAGEHYRFSVNSSLRQGLESIATEHQATLFMVLHAAFSQLLARYGNTDDVVVGTPVANRTRTELEPLVGFFVNTLVLRTEYDPNLDFAAHLAHVKAVNLAAQQHQDVPFDYLVESLKPVRSTRHAPLFQIMFTMNNTQSTPLALDGLTLTPVDAQAHDAHFDLTLNAEPVEGGLDFIFEYCTALFSQDTMAAMGRHLVALLEAVVTNTTQPIGQWPLLAGEDLAQVQQKLTGPAVAFPDTLTLSDMFRRQAEATPNNTAAIDTKGELSFAELDEKAAKVAHWLQSEGIQPGDLVGLCVNRDIDMVIGLLAINMAGGAVVPLDPDYPPQRLAYMVEDAAMTHVLSQSKVAGALAELPVTTTCIDTDLTNLSIEPLAVDAIKVASTDTAFVFYTSGSTGKPKGVEVDHKSLINYTTAMVSELSLTEKDRILQLASISFDVLLEELLPVWYAGGAVVLPGNDFVVCKAGLDEIVPKYGITGCEINAALWHEWVYEMQQTDSRPPAPLRLVMVGCESPQPECYRQWQEYDAELILVYGLTEVAITSTLFKSRSHEAQNRSAQTPGPLPIGRAVQNTTLHILDQAGLPVPAGVEGELYIAGDGLAKGYRGLPEQTAERFVDCPTAPGQRAYRTGDLVRLNRNGFIQFFGRRDHQVKIRGFRIELSEIQQALSKQGAIQSSHVMIREDVPGDKHIVAYYVPGTDGVTVSSLRTAMASALPEYMVPTRWVELERLPLSPNGKLDIKALPKPDASAQGVEYQAPEGEFQTKLVNLVAPLLQLEAGQVSATANFFELGGHSLLSIRLVAQVRSEWEIELNVREIFEQPTLAALAGIIEQQVVARAVARQQQQAVKETGWL